MSIVPKKALEYNNFQIFSPLVPEENLSGFPQNTQDTHRACANLA
jgi:hypothetical protein